MKTETGLERNMAAETDKSAGKCPVVHGTTNVGMRSNSDWWPNQLNLRILRQNSPQSDPMGKEFNYAEALNTLDSQELRKSPTARNPEGRASPRCGGPEFSRRSSSSPRRCRGAILAWIRFARRNGRWRSW